MGKEEALNIPIEHPCPDGQIRKFSRLSERQLGSMLAWAKGQLKLSGRKDFAGKEFMDWCVRVEGLPLTDPSVMNQIQSPEGIIEILLRSCSKDHPDVTGDQMSEWFWQETETMSMLAADLMPGAGEDDDPPAKASRRAGTGKQSSPRSTNAKAGA